MNAPTPGAAASPVEQRGSTVAILAGVAIGYTALNLLLREVANHVPAPVVAMWRLLPLLAWAAVVSIAGRAWTGMFSQPRIWRALAALLAGGAASYAFGNTVFQVALAAGGVAAAVPAAQAGLVAAGLVVDTVAFRERIPALRLVGAAAVLAGVAVVQAGMPSGRDAMVGIGFAMLAGASWSLSSVSVRYSYRYGITPAGALLVNGVGGFLVLAATNAWQGSGLGDWVPGTGMGLVLLAGLANTLALICSALALHRTGVALVGVFSASSVALSAAAAGWLFGEPVGGVTAAGVGLVLAGLVATARSASAPLARERRMLE